jgi:hypothetical protein
LVLIGDLILTRDREIFVTNTEKQKLFVHNYGKLVMPAKLMLAFFLNKVNKNQNFQNARQFLCHNKGNRQMRPQISQLVRPVKKLQGIK